MQFNVAAILFLFLGWFSSPQKVHNKLQKLYEKNKVKCEQLAKKYSSSKEKQAEAYFFLAKIYYDKAEKDTKLNAKYLNMSKCLSYAQKLKKTDTSKLYAMAEWNNLRNSIITSADTLVVRLNADGLTDKSEMLQRKVDKLEARSRIKEVPENKMLAVDETLKMAKKENGQFFGMPLGTEYVPSYNVASEKELVNILNKARKEKGMGELVWDEDLSRAARYHACDLATQDYFDHNTYDMINGKLVQIGGTFERIKKFYTKGFVNSENIAAGNESASNTYTQWYNSPGHYANMFNPSSKKVGVGVFYDANSSYGYYWAFCTALN